jgi:hypothetical protein
MEKQQLEFQKLQETLKAIDEEKKKQEADFQMRLQQ